MRVIARDEGHIVFEQLGDQCLADHDLLMIEYHYANVFNGYGGLRFFFKSFRQIRIFLYCWQPHDELIKLGAQVSRVAEVKGALDHDCENGQRLLSKHSLPFAIISPSMFNRTFIALSLICDNLKDFNFMHSEISFSLL